MKCPKGHPAIPSKAVPGLLYCLCTVSIVRTPKAKPGHAVGTMDASGKVTLA